MGPAAPPQHCPYTSLDMCFGLLDELYAVHLVARASGAVAGSMALKLLVAWDWWWVGGDLSDAKDIS